jgi:predicted alpha/beta-hydrolase family hydrolase
MENLPLERIAIRIDDERAVSGLLHVPDRATACFVLAHGAGAGMEHAFMTATAAGLGQRGIATLRYQFCFMEAGLKRPDAPRTAHAAVRAAVAEAGRRIPALPLFAGGKSFGGRMTSQAQAETALPRIGGLIFLGFPLHAARKPADDRARHLSDVHIPMLFLQGTRDLLAEPSLLIQVAAHLGLLATLHLVADADHSFHVPARSGRTGEQVLGEILDRIVAWIEQIALTVKPL